MRNLASRLPILMVLGAVVCVLPASLFACPFCAEAVRRINNGHLLDSYLVAYIILAFMPLVLIGIFALTLYRFHKRKTAASTHHT